MKRQGNAIGIIGVLIIGAALGFLMGARINLPQPAAVQTPAQEASVMIDDGSGAIKVLRGEPLENETLFDFMRRLLAAEKIDFAYKEYGDLGALVEAIGEVKNSPARYWQYWVNNNFAPVGASTYLVKAGDVIEWQYLKEQPML